MSGWLHGACNCCNCPADCDACATSFVASFVDLQVAVDFGAGCACDSTQVCTFGDFDVTLTQVGSTCFWENTSPGVTDCEAESGRDYQINAVTLFCDSPQGLPNDPAGWIIEIEIATTSANILFLQFQSSIAACPVTGTYTFVQDYLFGGLGTSACYCGGATVSLA